MLKIFKVLVAGLEGAEEILGRNQQYTTSMGYNEQTKEIRVLVERVILPELGSESVDLRPQHTTATYETVDERVFKEADFPQSKEYMKWVVEFDVTTGKITDPINVLELTKPLIDNTTTARRIPTMIYNRYSENLLPLFALDQFYKNSPGFDGAVLTFYDDQTGNDLNSTTIEYEDAELVTQAEKEYWFAYWIHRHVHYELLDNNGKIIASALTTTKPEAKSPQFVDSHKLNVLDANTTDTFREGAEKFKIELPAALAQDVKIRMCFSSPMYQLGQKFADVHKVSSTYDVSCINCVANKTRLTADGEFDASQQPAASFFEQHVPRVLAGEQSQSDKTARKHLAGFENLTIKTTDLVAGDYFKVKLNLGDFVSFSELWVQLV
jgi:hypothetical protein